jgi:hypothetical protein
MSQNINNIVFETQEITNNNFIVCDLPWSFETDLQGESMYCERYGGVHFQNITLPSSFCTYLANNEMTIKFKISNSTYTNYEVESFNLVIVNTFEILDVTSISRLTPTERNTNDFYSSNISLKNSSISFNQNFKVLKACEVGYFKIKISCNNCCQNQIKKFKFEIKLRDGNQRITINSDKFFFLGCF